MTVKELAERLASMPPDAVVFGYVGRVGIHIQAEWPGDGTDPGQATVLLVPMEVGGGGNAA